MAKTELTIPSLIKSTCEIYSNVSNIEGIRMNIYKWCGTDRVTIQWVRTKGSGSEVIGKMEMHFLELYDSIGDVLRDREYLTNVMAEQNWGLLDLRNIDKMREFDENFH